MKRVICAEDIEAVVKQGQKKLRVETGAIVTPAAKDAAKAAKVQLCPAKSEAECIACKEVPCGAENSNECDAAACEDEISSDTIYAALKTMLGKGLLDGATDSASELPYAAESGSGLKLVRGKSVKMDLLDTGNPDAKACYREVIGSYDGAHMGAGFLEIDHSRFEWVLEGYEEIDYVIEGTLTISINGKTFTGHAGDVFFVPSGAKVVWSSPDKARMFYATYLVD